MSANNTSVNNIRINKETVGQKAFELFDKVPDSLNVTDLMQEQLTEWEAQVQCCYNRGKKIYPNQDFYIDVWTKWERAFGHKVIRRYFIPKRACPTPQWDQTVYRCAKGSDDIQYLWTLPDKTTYNNYLENPAIVPKEQWELLNFVLKDRDGDLLRLAKKLNGEPLD